jgi:hypothetical protein
MPACRRLTATRLTRRPRVITLPRSRSFRQNWRMQALAIDPSNERSAWVGLDGAAIVDRGIAENPDVLARVRRWTRGGVDAPEHMAIEVIASWSDTKRGVPPRATTGSTDEGARTA